MVRQHLFLVAGGVVVFTILISGLIYFASKPLVLGVISPLADDYAKNEAQYRFVFDKKTIDSYPPNEYFPKTLTPQFTDNLDVSAKAYAVMERKSGELLLAKGLNQERSIASVTKIMTAIVALEHASFETELIVSSAAATIGEAVMGLTPGEKVTVEELLYGLLLPSGNDAAETLAEGLIGGQTGFMLAMNQKARELGLADTYFFNPTGLDGTTPKTTSFSTCLDLLALANYALQNPRFAEIVSTRYKEFPYKEGKHKAFYLENILQLDQSFPGIKGIKPGVTDFARETLVSYAENGGKRVIVVLLSSDRSRDDAVKIYDYIFPKLGVKVR